jgi:hypothetical protein
MNRNIAKIEQQRARGSAYLPIGSSIGSSSSRFGTLYTQKLDSITINSTTCNISYDGPFSITAGTNILTSPNTNLVAERKLYSTKGYVNSISNTATTFSVNSTGEAGLYYAYTPDYSAICVGLYCHTATPSMLISTGSPALQVTISGSNLQIAFATAPASPKTIYWKKLKFNS